MTSSSMMNSSSDCDNGGNAKLHYLYPAAIFVNKTPHTISTILGSCVAVCLWDKALGYGGMNHYMLPLWNGNGLASPKYGNIAIKKLLEKMEGYGSNRKNLIAKVFGGGEVLDSISDQFNIGGRNINVAQTLLKELDIPIVGSSLGGKLGRKIVMCTQTGEVRMRFVKKQNLK